MLGRLRFKLVRRFTPSPYPLPHHVLRSGSEEVENRPAQHVTGEREHVLTDFLSAHPGLLPVAGGRG